MVSYVGVERTIISYNFTLNIWTMRDVTNPSVTAVSEASLRSLAIGNILWTISNDTKCSQGYNKTELISLIQCPCYCRNQQQGALSHLLLQLSVHLQ